MQRQYFFPTSYRKKSSSCYRAPAPRTIKENQLALGNVRRLGLSSRRPTFSEKVMTSVNENQLSAFEQELLDAKKNFKSRIKQNLDKIKLVPRPEASLRAETLAEKEQGKIVKRRSSQLLTASRPRRSGITQIKNEDWTAVIPLNQRINMTQRTEKLQPIRHFENKIKGWDYEEQMDNFFD